MARVVKAPKRSDLHPGIVEFFNRNKDWHGRHGFGVDYELEDVLKDFVYIVTPEFLMLITDDSKDYHGNVGLAVFRRDGTLIDVCNYYHEDAEHPHAPKKSFSGVPIVSDRNPFRFVPKRKRDRSDPL